MKNTTMLGISVVMIVSMVYGADHNHLRPERSLKALRASAPLPTAFKTAAASMLSKFQRQDSKSARLSNPRDTAKNSLSLARDKMETALALASVFDPDPDLILITRSGSRGIADEPLLSPAHVDVDLSVKPRRLSVSSSDSSDTNSTTSTPINKTPQSRNRTSPHKTPTAARFPVSPYLRPSDPPSPLLRALALDDREREGRILEETSLGQTALQTACIVTQIQTLVATPTACTGISCTHSSPPGIICPMCR